MNKTIVVIDIRISQINQSCQKKRWKVFKLNEREHVPFYGINVSLFKHITTHYANLHTVIMSQSGIGHNS